MSFFLFSILGWNFIPVFRSGIKSHPCLSSRDQISSRQKRVNSKRHFTIDRDDFIPGWVSTRDEISRVNTLLILDFNLFQFLWFCVRSSLNVNVLMRKKGDMEYRTHINKIGIKTRLCVNMNHHFNALLCNVVKW